MVTISRPIPPLVSQRVTPVVKDGPKGVEHLRAPQGTTCNTTARMAAEVVEGTGEA